MSLPTVTMSGTLTADPELRFVGQDGVAVASFTLAGNDRKFNRDTNQWQNGEPTYIDCVAWKTLAENITENLKKGSHVIARGSLKQESWEKDGQKRSRLKLEVDDLGPSLKFAQKAVARSNDPWG